MPLCPGTDLRITIRLILDTQLVLGGKSHDFAGKSFIPKDLHSFLGHGPGNSTGRQIKHFFGFPFTAGTDGGKQCGHSLSHAGRCLDEELFFPQNGTVNGTDHIFLPFPVRKRELHALHGSVSLFSPLPGKFNPGVVAFQNIRKPHIQLLKAVAAVKIHDLLCVQIGISHPNTDRIQLMVMGIDPGIAFCLSQMHRHRFFHSAHIPVHPLNLIDHRQFFLVCKYAIRPAFQFNGILRIFLYIEKRHLTLVAGFLTFLYFPMEAAALLHGLPVRSAPVTTVQIAASQNKFYKAPY